MRNHLLFVYFAVFSFGLNNPSVYAEEPAEAVPADESAIVSEIIQEESEEASADLESVAEDEKEEATGENPVVIIKTSMGDIKLQLFEEKAPLTVENFLKYTDTGHYNGTIFHRVIGNFMIQGGGFTPDMQQKSTMAPIKNEAENGLSNKRGTVAMARTGVIDSATSQFFINVVDNDMLNHSSPDPRGFGYCVFGEVIEGMDVVDAIRSVPTGRSGPHGDVPREPVVINEVVRVSAE